MSLLDAFKELSGLESDSREIPGATGYFAHSDGSIWSHRGATPRRLKPDLRKEDRRKRYTIRLSNGKYLRKYGAEFVLYAFVGPRPAGLQCCHENGDCTNDSIDNLRWGTELSNKADMLRHGTRMQGDELNTSKLTEKDVLEIRRRFSEGGITRTALGSQFGVSCGTIGLIISRRSWKHI